MYLITEQRVLSAENKDTVVSFDFSMHQLETIPDQVFIKPDVVESLDLSSNTLSDISRLGELVSLRLLDLSGKKCVSLESLVFIFVTH